MFLGIIGSPVAVREAIQRGRIVPCLPGFAGVRYPGDSSGLHSERSGASCWGSAESSCSEEEDAASRRIAELDQEIQQLERDSQDLDRHTEAVKRIAAQPSSSDSL